jgi:benzoyl-CoA 2,3-dioxygenase component B
VRPEIIDAVGGLPQHGTIVQNPGCLYCATSTVDYGDRIPNNVDLGRDRVLQRALEHWQPQYMGWWYDMGPAESRAHDVYLRTAVSVDPDGWAVFDFIKMPDYRWGIFLAPPEAGRQVNWHQPRTARLADVPGRYRSALRGDVTQATPNRHRSNNSGCSVCRARRHDLRNIYQVNVEEGRHL